MASLVLSCSRSELGPRKHSPVEERDPSLLRQGLQGFPESGPVGTAILEAELTGTHWSGSERDRENLSELPKEEKATHNLSTPYPTPTPAWEGNT